MTAASKRRRPLGVRNIVVISDTHCGCQMGLCSRSGGVLDGGVRFQPSRLQSVMLDWWDEFWGEHVPHATRGEPFALIHNGDAIDGVHHNATTQITHNIERQRAIAYDLLAPVAARAEGGYWHIRGTEAHVGPSAEHEEALAKALSARPDEDGRHARWELRLRIGGHLIHFTHHIAATTSPFAESGALQREAVQAAYEGGRFGDEPYSMLVRSHRHQHSEIATRGAHGKVTVTVTPAWQLKTPYVYKTNARMGQPQIGGLVIRLADDELFTRPFVRRISPPREEAL